MSGTMKRRLSGYVKNLKKLGLKPIRSDSEMRTQTGKIVGVAKINEVIGVSKKSWEDAAQEAETESKKLIDEMYSAVNKAKNRARVVRAIKRLDVQNMTAKVNFNTGIITQYQVHVKLVYRIKHSRVRDRIVRTGRERQ
jgi:flavin-binding protein dodecin